MQTRHVLLLGAALTVLGTACRGDDEDPNPTPDAGGTGNPDSGVVVMGDCPTGTGSSLTVCELKKPGNPRQPAVGDPIEVANVIVTTNPFSITQTSTSGVNGFFVQDMPGGDLGGRYGGIVVTYFADPTPATLPARGDVVTVIGTLNEYRGQSQIQLTTVTVTGNATPEPMTVDPASIATNGADDEAYEGSLVRVENVEATQVRDVPGAAGSSIFGAILVTGGLVVRNGLTDVRADVGETFSQITGVLRVGTVSFDEGIYALFPRDSMDIQSNVTGVRDIVTLQDPSAAEHPSICTQRGAASTRMGTCPRVSLDNVVVTAADDVENGRVSFWVQDPSVEGGRFAGVRVFNATLEGGTTLEVGNVVSLSGIGVLYFDALQIANATVNVVEAGTEPTPVTVMAADIPGEVTASGGEIVNPYEGVLVRVEGVDVTSACVDSSGDRGYFQVAGSVIIGGEFDYGYNGSFAADAMCGDGTRTGDMRTVGDRFQSITGIMDYSFNQFRLNPRSDADLVLE